MIKEYIKLLKGEVIDNSSSIFRIVKKDNIIWWIEMKLIKIEWENEDVILNLLFDIIEWKLVEEEIKFLSYYD